MICETFFRHVCTVCVVSCEFHVSVHGLSPEIHYEIYPALPEGWDSAVGIASCYRLDGPGIEYSPDWPWGPHSLLQNRYRVFPEGGGVKRPGATLTTHPI